MDFKIIDFHTHPFINNSYNICSHTEFCDMSAEKTKSLFQSLGVGKICGSVISNDTTAVYKDEWDRIKDWNNRALELTRLYGDFYHAGFHIHPDFPDESMAEIERMSSLGVNLVGELVPYKCGYTDYNSDSMNAIVDFATEKNMIISLHTMDNDDLDSFVKRHKDTVIVAAHPGEYDDFVRHMQRMHLSENYYLDISGYGVFRYGMLRHAIDECGAERLLFGSDYPTCSPAMYIGSVTLDDLITPDERAAILHHNAKKLLKL